MGEIRVSANEGGGSGQRRDPQVVSDKGSGVWRWCEAVWDHYEVNDLLRNDVLLFSSCLYDLTLLSSVLLH